MTHSPRTVIAPLAVTAVVAVIYLSTASRTVLGGDVGEFDTLFFEGGVAHPSGYPLYTLLLRALSWLPASSPAHGASCVTALLGALTAGALVLACRRWGASDAASVLAALVYATSPRAWGLATEAEVFTLNATIAALILCAAAPVPPSHAQRRAMWLCAAAGAGLANHLTIVLLAPVGVCALLQSLGASERPWRTLGVGALALIPGLSIYASLLIVARHPGGRWLWADTRTLGSLLHHVVRADYGVGQLSTRGGAPQPLAQLLALGTDVLRDGLWLPAAVGLAVVGISLVRWRSPRERAWLLLAITFLVAGPLFALRMNVAPVGVGAAIVARFHLLPEVVLTVFVARGFDRVARAMALPTRAAYVLAVGAGAIGAATSLGGVLGAHQPVIENYVRDTLTSVDPRAVVMGTGDHRQLGILYAQRALGLRRDVVYIDPWLLLLPAPRARAEAALGIRLPPLHGRSVDTLAVARAVLATGRPLYLTDVFTPAIVQALPSYPVGTVIRVLQLGARPPSPDVLFSLNQSLVQRFSARRPDAPVDAWAALTRDDYARPWTVLAAIFDARGDAGRAAVCRQRALALTPTTQ